MTNPPPVPPSTEFTDEDLELVQQLADARKNSSQWRKHEDECRKLVLDRLGSAEVALTGAGVQAVHLQKSLRKKLNADKLEALYPDIYDEVMEDVETVTVKIDL